MKSEIITFYENLIKSVLPGCEVEYYDLGSNDGRLGLVHTFVVHVRYKDRDFMERKVLSQGYEVDDAEECLKLLFKTLLWVRECELLRKEGRSQVENP